MSKGYKRWIVLLSACFLVTGCENQSIEQQGIESYAKEEEAVHVPSIDTSELSTPKEAEYTNGLEKHPLFRIDELSDSQIDAMTGVTWTEAAPVSLEELRSVVVTYRGFDEETYLGRVIIHEEVAEDIRDIFQELYEAGFSIERITPIYHYDGSDDASMAANNTSAFNFREMTGSSNISVHGYGRAIDINPLVNPYVKGTTVLPEEGEDYINREDIEKGMITQGDFVYQAFISRGWTWGGDWRTLKDYQHFEKKN